MKFASLTIETFVDKQNSYETGRIFGNMCGQKNIGSGLENKQSVWPDFTASKGKGLNDHCLLYTSRCV